MSTEDPRNANGMTEDDLWSALDGQVGAERASTLVEIAEMMLARGAATQALPLAEAAVEEAAASENEQQMARAHTVLGTCLYELDRYGDAARSHREAARLFEKYDSVRETVRAYFNLSAAQELSGDLEGALASADIALASAEQDDASDYLGHIHRQKASVLGRLGRPDAEVLESLSAARREYRDSAMVAEVLDVDREAANVFLDAEEYDAAINLLRDCLAVATSLDASRAAYFSFRLGVAHLCAGDPLEGLAHLQRAFEHNEAVGDIRRLASCQLQMARCHWRLGNEDEALLAVGRARAHYDVVGNDYWVRECDDMRATWFHGVGRYDDAVALNTMLVNQCAGGQRFLARTRLADNYRCIGDMEATIAHTEPEDDDDQFAGTAHWFWRECVRARALDALGRHQEAWLIAHTCVAMDFTDADPHTQACLHELVGDEHAAAGREGEASTWWSRAVALYLSARDVASASRLSEAFLPASPAAIVH